LMFAAEREGCNRDAFPPKGSGPDRHPPIPPMAGTVSQSRSASTRRRKLQGPKWLFWVRISAKVAVRRISTVVTHLPSLGWPRARPARPLNFAVDVIHYGYKEMCGRFAATGEAGARLGSTSPSLDPAASKRKSATALSIVERQSDASYQVTARFARESRILQKRNGQWIHQKSPHGAELGNPSEASLIGRSIAKLRRLHHRSQRWPPESPTGGSGEGL
jgi:hypothetical protein